MNWIRPACEAIIYCALIWGCVACEKFQNDYKIEKLKVEQGMKK